MNPMKKYRYQSPMQPTTTTPQSPAVSKAGCSNATAPVHHACCKSAGAPTHDEIAERAYELYAKAGCKPGHCQENWYAAEQSLRDQAQAAYVAQQAQPEAFVFQAVAPARASMDAGALRC
jgi:hypothetical protein